MSLGVDVLTGAVRGGTSILYAGVGETISERAGVINLGTEGSMLCGALAGYAFTAVTGSPWLGVIAGGLGGAALSALFGYLVLHRGANQLATGLIVLFLALGLTALFGAPYVQRQINNFTPYTVPMLGSLPFIGKILFRHDPLTYLSFFIGPAAWYMLTRTRWGLVLRGAGERPEVLSVYGYSARRVRLVAVTAGGFLAGVGGAQLSTAYANAWFQNMVQGRGFIAVALVIFAAWQPLRVVGGAYLFGAALALSPALQARGYGFNQFALDAIPYIVTIGVLVVLGRKRVDAAPEGLKAVFELTPSR